jgi:hypothetical protein
MKRYLNYSNITATIALIFAMGGSAIAAKHYLITNINQIKPSIIHQLKGEKGEQGEKGEKGLSFIGPRGYTGEQGYKGEQGESRQGPIGLQGPIGPKGEKGEIGETGQVEIGYEWNKEISYPYGQIVWTEGLTKPWVSSSPNNLNIDPRKDINHEFWRPL